jgi:hypothetical protein
LRAISDVFPALVWIAPPNSIGLDEFTIPGPSPEGTRKVDRVRVVLLGDSILIAQDSPDGPTLVFREKFTHRHVEGKLQAVLTESEKVIAFIKDASCGCGSRLRGWNPYGQNSSVYSSEDPTE